MNIQRSKRVSHDLRLAASLLRPGLVSGEAGWWSCTSALCAAAQYEQDGGPAGLFYTAMGDFDEWVVAHARPLGIAPLIGSAEAYERQCLRVMYLELLACIAESEGC